MRDYRAELATEKKNHPERAAERAARNRARRKVANKLGAAAVKGKEIDHANARPTDNRMINLRVVSPKANNHGRRGGAAMVRGRK